MRILHSFRQTLKPDQESPPEHALLHPKFHQQQEQPQLIDPPYCWFEYFQWWR